jgi:Xaa-Pro aminopeptidase
MERIKRVREAMKEKGVDYLILGPGSNMFYLSGFTEEQMERPLFLVLDQWNTYFLAPKLYEEQLSKTHIEVITYMDGENPYKKLEIERGKIIAIDDTLWSSFTIDIINTFSPSQLIKASEIMREVRMIKSKEEIEIMKEGVKIAEKSFLETISHIRDGMKEIEIAQLLIRKFIENGAERVSFEPIVTSGPNTSMPHLRSTEKKVKNGEIMIFDFGVKYKGYSTDTTRVVSLGKPEEDVLKVYEIVKNAQELAKKEVREGVKACEIDRIARSYISSHDYGNYFIHRTGHGIGIDVHEEPYISPDSKRAIQKGMVFTIEPGIYLPGKFGVRVEDMVYVDKEGGITFNSLNREIFII